MSKYLIYGGDEIWAMVSFAFWIEIGNGLPRRWFALADETAISARIVKDDGTDALVAVGT
jgi:hypothetical protein